MDIVLTFTGTSDSGPCPCCGDFSRRISGSAQYADGSSATYDVHWTIGRVAEFGAHFDMVLDLGGEKDAGARFAASLLFRNDDEEQGFMVIDAAGRPHATSPGIEYVLARRHVVGQPIAAFIFALCDAILLDDERVNEAMYPASSVSTQTPANH